PDLVPLLKSESLLIAAAEQLGCGFEDLNTLFVERAGALTSSTELGALVAQDYQQTGYFATG
ncbi:MAG: hypothetical protein KJ956_13980, partial [Actinobacteria bacterium]|nr:hypothetical protein [Actinomycetota bacterium]